MPFTGGLHHLPLIPSIILYQVVLLPTVLHEWLAHTKAMLASQPQKQCMFFHYICDTTPSGAILNIYTSSNKLNMFFLIWSWRACLVSTVVTCLNNHYLLHAASTCAFHTSEIFHCLWSCRNLLPSTWLYISASTFIHPNGTAPDRTLSLAA